MMKKIIITDCVNHYLNFGYSYFKNQCFNLFCNIYKKINWVFKNYFVQSIKLILYNLYLLSKLNINYFNQLKNYQNYSIF